MARRSRRRRRAFTIALAAALAVGAVSINAPHRLAAADGLDADIQASVAYWSAAYNIDPAYIERVIMCESSGNRWAVNPASGALGLLQYLPATFIALENRLNADPTLAPGLSTYDPDWRGVDDADAQTHVFSWSVAHGLQSLWACA